MNPPAKKVVNKTTLSIDELHFQDVNGHHYAIVHVWAIDNDGKKKAFNLAYVIKQLYGQSNASGAVRMEINGGTFCVIGPAKLMYAYIYHALIDFNKNYIVLRNGKAFTSEPTPKVRYS